MLYKVPFDVPKFAIFTAKLKLYTFHISSTNFHTYNVSSYHQMSLDPLNVRILKIYVEILVVAFFVVFFLIEDERDFVILRMEIYLRMGPFNKLT